MTAALERGEKVQLSGFGTFEVKEREKRIGRVERIDSNTCKYVVDTYDASELLPWIRSFIGRIEKLECSDESVATKFYENLEQLYLQYGGEA